MASGSKRAKFMTRDARPRMATDDDFAAIFSEANLPVIAQDIPIDRIRPNPFQPRMEFDVSDLVEGMRVHGFTSRLRVRRDPDEEGVFQLVYGERRLRAAREVGIALIPCDIATHSNEEMRELALTENLNRADLSPIEEAKAFQFALDAGYTVRSLAERISKDKGYIENRLAVLKAPPDVQDMVRQRDDTLRAARELAKLPDEEERRPLIAGLLDSSLRKADVTEIVRERLASPAQDTDVTIDRDAARRQGSNRHLSSDPAPSVSTSSQPPKEQLASRRMDRDITQVQTIFQRWRTDLPETTEERAKLIACLDRLIPQFEELLEALKAPMQE
jgi:ParB family chromosome partitioning protein